jgi:hypothetical protein
MTAKEFRRAALALPGVIESAHMHHPDFRVANRIFATLGSPDEAWGMVKLPPEESRRLIDAMPQVFAPAAGAWGRQGSTLVRLAEARAETMERALELAWQAQKMKESEAIAKRVLEAMLPGAKLAFRVEQSHHECDFDLRYPDGNVAAVEVTIAVDEISMETVAVIRGNGARGSVIDAVVCKKSWVIYTANGARIHKIRKDADRLIAKLEGEGIDGFDQWKPGCSETVRELCCELGVTEGYVLSSAGRPTIRIGSPIRGGVVGDALAIIEAGEACMEGNREKLGAAKTAERHLVVYIHPLSNARSSTFTVSQPPEETLPTLPQEITNIWLIGDGENRDEFVVWYASTKEPWRSAKVVCAPETSDTQSSHKVH